MANGKQDGKDDQHARFLEVARALGCDEDEAAFDEKLKGIAKPVLKTEPQKTMTDPVGWYVRVGGLPVWDGVYDTALYIAGHRTPAEAKAAVRDVCRAPDANIDVLPDPIWPGHGPQPALGEVRLLPGAA